MLTVVLWILVFLSTAAIDAVQAYWLRAFNQGNANRAAALSVLEYAIGCLCFYAFVEQSWWLIIPECAGLWVGSQISVRRISKQKAADGIGLASPATAVP